MRFISILFLLFLVTFQSFAGSSQITITPPTITSGLGGYESTVNTQIASMTSLIQNTINNQGLSNLHDLNELTRAFANANAAASNNVGFLGFQNYDVCTIMLGSNFGVASPTFNPLELGSMFNSVQTNGDIYAGLATGGIAGQLGINTSAFLVKNLYLSVKFGILNMSQDSGSGSSKFNFTYQQFLIGLGANYKLIEPWDLGWGFARWRGVSAGTGITVNSNTIQMKFGYADQIQSQSNVSGGNYTVDTTVTNIQANLKVTSLSFTVPVELDTSVQILYLLNLGLGLGADINLPLSSVKLDGGANVNCAVRTAGGTPVPITTSPGSVSIVGTDSKNNVHLFDFISPRVSTDIGLNIWLFRLDVPMSFYPATKAYTIGISGGFSW